MPVQIIITVSNRRDQLFLESFSRHLTQGTKKHEISQNLPKTTITKLRSYVNKKTLS